jgi:hypothetical protein
VAVYEAKKIPKFADVCVGCNVYRLYFKPDEVAQHDGSDPKDDDLLSDEDGNSKEKDRHNPDFEMAEANPEKELEDPSASQSQPPPQHGQNLNQASLFREALDLACNNLFNEISIKVMLEHDVGTSRKNYTLLTKEELGSYNTPVDSPAKIHPSSVLFPPSPETQVDVLPAIFQKSKDDVVEIVGDPTSPEGSTSAGGFSPASPAIGTMAAEVLAVASVGGVEDTGSVPCGGAEDPEGAATCAPAATCASAGAVADAGDSGTASLVSTSGAGEDVAAVNSTGAEREDADASGCCSTASGAVPGPESSPGIVWTSILPAGANAPVSSPMETMGTSTTEVGALSAAIAEEATSVRALIPAENVQVLNQSEVMERDAAEQMGEKDLAPGPATLAVAVVPSTCLHRSKRVAVVADVHTLHKA